MKVKDLLKELAKINGDLEVRLGMDEGASIKMVSIQRVLGVQNCLLLMPERSAKDPISQQLTPEAPGEE